MGWAGHSSPILQYLPPQRPGTAGVKSWVRSQSSAPVNAQRTGLSPTASYRKDWSQPSPASLLPEVRSWSQPPQYPSAPGPSTHSTHGTSQPKHVPGGLCASPGAQSTTQLPDPSLHLSFLLQPSGSSSKREICLCQQGGQELRRDKSASARVMGGQRDKKIHAGKATDWI